MKAVHLRGSSLDCAPFRRSRLSGLAERQRRIVTRLRVNPTIEGSINNGRFNMSCSRVRHHLYK